MECNLDSWPDLSVVQHWHPSDGTLLALLNDLVPVVVVAALHLDGNEEDELATGAEEAEEDFDAEVDAVAEELALGPPVVFELPTSMDRKPVLHAIEMSMDPVLGTMKKAEEGEEEDVGYQREQSLLHLVAHGADSRAVVSTCVGAALSTKGHVIECISVVHIGSVERLLPIWWLHLLSAQTDWLLSNNHHMRSTRRRRNTDTCSGCGCRGCYSGSGHLYTHSSRCWSTTTTCSSPTLRLHWMDHCRRRWWWGQRRCMMILMRMVLLLLLVMMMRRMMLMNMMMVRLLMMIVVMVIIVKILICWRQWITQIIIAASGRRPSIAAAVVAFDLVRKGPKHDTPLDRFRDPVVTFLDLLEWFILSYDPGGDVQERVRLVLLA
uniref:Uncharacterized protein n=1 Tax=Anopheles melas TaxID=34690 RepID=A0A182U7X7_9DIPT